MLSFKNVVLKHPNPQFSHKYMWNIFAGRCGPRLKCPRDMKNEHLNKFLKGGFRSLGVNLNEDTATRINNAADLGMELQDKVNAFFEIDPSGKSHSSKDRCEQIARLAKVLRKEAATDVVPGRQFSGPRVLSSIDSMFDEAKYRSWHWRKENEYAKFESLRRTFFDE